METPVARLRRLQAEVAQLEAEMKASSDSATSRPAPPKRRSAIPARPRVDVVTELSTLREKLNVLSGDQLVPGPTTTVDWQARLQQLELSQSEPEEAASTKDETAQHAADSINVGDVDKRLTSLEQQVGVADDNDVRLVQMWVHR